MSHSNPAPILHFIHGTWPYGFFRRRSHGDMPAWFEEDSDFLAGLGEYLDCPAKWQAFNWSGRNSFAARIAAADELIDYLQQAHLDNPGAPHIIVAHSHGGTVAENALRNLPRAFEKTHRIKALICMATPFAYITRNTEEQTRLFGLGFVVFMLSIAWLYGILSTPRTGILSWMVFASILGFLVGAAALLTAFSHTAPPARYCCEEQLAHGVSLFVLRSTQDEAALSIGAAQAMHALIHRLYMIYQSSATTSSLQVFLLKGALVLAVGLTGNAFLYLFVGTHFFDDSLGLAHWQSVLSTSALWVATALFPVVFSHLLLVFAAGYWNAKSWFSSTVEVDAVPMQLPVEFKAYISEPGAFRHGIYNLPDVQRDVSILIDMVAQGYTPHFYAHRTLDMIDFIT